MHEKKIEKMAYVREEEVVAVLLVEREHGWEHRVAEQKVSVMRPLG